MPATKRVKMRIKKMSDNPIYCAIDTPLRARAEELAAMLSGAVGGLKIGMEYFYAHGGDGYRALAAFDQPIFLDLKLHDIPNTVASAIRALAPLQPALLNVHAGGGAAMMRAAADAASEARDKGLSAPHMLAVTILTSLEESDLHDMGVHGTPREQVLRLAHLAKANGMDGVVCSAHEIEALRAELGPEFKLIVPGIRPAGSAAHDQKRVMTPEAAKAAGADILVIGRAITGAEDPHQAALNIAAGLVG